MDYFKKKQWKDFKVSLLPEPIKNMMLLTMEFGFYPIIDYRNDYHSDWVLINQTDCLMIEWCGWSTIYWSLYDTTKPHPNPYNSGMKYIPLLQSFGEVDKDISREAAILIDFLKRYKNGEKSTS